ncbi:MAG: helix-turn-helix transcriptional regulator [Halobacteriales archaeon]
MEPKKTAESLVERKGDAVAGVLLTVSVAVLGAQMLNPTPIMISVENGATEVEQVPGFFTYTDVIVVSVSSVVAGMSATYLLTPDTDATEPEAEATDGVDIIEQRRREWEERANELRNGEKEIYEVVLDSDGVVEQSTIVEETDLSKSHVSRKLDVLESRKLVERKRRGMRNVVVLK